MGAERGLWGQQGPPQPPAELPPHPAAARLNLHRLLSCTPGQMSPGGAGVTWAGPPLGLDITFSRHLRARALSILPKHPLAALLPTEPRAPRRGPVLLSSLPPHLARLKFINSRPKPPRVAQLLQLAPAARRAQPLTGGPGQMLVGTGGSWGPFPAPRPLQPGLGGNRGVPAAEGPAEGLRAQGGTVGELRTRCGRAEALLSWESRGTRGAAGLGRGPGRAPCLIQSRCYGSQRLPPVPLSSFSSFPSGAAHVKPNPPVTWFKGRARE